MVGRKEVEWYAMLARGTLGLQVLAQEANGLLVTTYRLRISMPFAVRRLTAYFGERDRPFRRIVTEALWAGISPVAAT
jgi:hypothetical protein